MDPLTALNYPSATARRDQLLSKWHSGFSADELARSFDDHPGWSEEFRRRSSANLSADELQELEQLQDAIDVYDHHQASVARAEIQLADRLVNHARNRIERSKQKKQQPPPSLGIGLYLYLGLLSAAAVLMLLLPKYRHLFFDE